MVIIIVPPDTNPRSQVKNNVLSLAGFFQGFKVTNISLNTADSKCPVEGILPPGIAGHFMTLGDQSFDQSHANKTATSCNQNLHQFFLSI